MFAETHTRVQEMWGGGGKWGGKRGGGWGDEGGLGIGGGVTSSPHHLVNTCAAKSAPTHQIRILWGVGRWAGCVLVSISERAGSRTLEKFLRRDRDRDCAKFESSRRFRDSNMSPKKKSRRYRASVSIQALGLAISRFTNSLGINNASENGVKICRRCR